MIVKIKKNATEEQVKHLLEFIKEEGFDIHASEGENSSIYGIVGDTAGFDDRRFYAFAAVDTVMRVQEPFKKVNRKMNPEDTIINVGGIEVGGKDLVVMAGPCSVESEEQVDRIAKQVKAAGATMLRGGAFKPRTSPYAYQGMGVEGLKILKKVGDKYGMPIVSEMMDTDNIEAFEEYVDVIQIGARNMQNFSLLKALGKMSKPILLKRGFSNTIEEWLMSAEYIMAGGNEQVILCERGIRTFERATRNTLDIATIPVVKKLSHLPIVIDPSHAAGKWDYVESLSLAAAAGGCDGLIIEVHDDPEHAWSDGAQSLKPEKFEKLMDKVTKVHDVIKEL